MVHRVCTFGGDVSGGEKRLLQIHPRHGTLHWLVGEGVCSGLVNVMFAINLIL